MGILTLTGYRHPPTSSYSGRTKARLGVRDPRGAAGGPPKIVAVANTALEEIRSGAREIEEIRGALERHRDQLESAGAILAEAFASASLQLTEASREADFTPDPYRGGLGGAIELKLSETREMTVTIGRDAQRPGPPGQGGSR